MKIYHLAFLLFAFLLVACTPDKEDIQPNCDFKVEAGTRFFKFGHSASGLTFFAWTADTAVINTVLKQLELPEEERKQFLNGPIAKVPEGCSLNGDWSWYFVSNEWALTDFSIELCDGTPQFVEENVDEYIRIGGYCPWSAFVKWEVDQPF